MNTIYDRTLGNPAYDPDDPRTYGTEEAIAYLREQRERAAAAWRERFDVPAKARSMSAREAMHTGNWGGFFGGLLA